MTEQEHYRMTTERVEEIAAAGEISPERVRDYCCADWPEGEEHQQWLDQAPAAEIAAWIKAGG